MARAENHCALGGAVARVVAWALAGGESGVLGVPCPPPPPLGAEKPRRLELPMARDSINTLEGSCHRHMISRRVSRDIIFSLQSESLNGVSLISASRYLGFQYTMRGD